MLTRNPHNPLLRPADVTPWQPDFEVIGAFNAGVTVYQNEILMLVRVAERPRTQIDGFVLCPYLDDSGQLVIEQIALDDPEYDTSDPRLVFRRDSSQLLLTSMSHLRLARSHDGIQFEIDPLPWLIPQPPYERYGIEDARITQVDDVFYVNYSTVGPQGIATGLARTRDFQTIERLGIMLPPSNRDVTIIPACIGGRYYCYHRPMPSMFGGLNIWGASSPDLMHWGDHHLLLTQSLDGWESGRIGGGAPPVRTERGWLSIYHAADSKNRYCLGAFLTDLNDPLRVIARSAEPILVPEASYEVDGFFGQVVFTCGAIVDGDSLRIYYGAADESMALAEGSLSAILDSLTAL